MEAPQVTAWLAGLGDQKKVFNWFRTLFVFPKLVQLAHNSSKLFRSRQRSRAKAQQTGRASALLAYRTARANTGAHLQR